jgi:uroporphyrin-III C-methyltransferase
MPMVERIASGEVWLVGAGPGDPDLLTRKAERLIAAADIVFYDALVGPGILDLIADGIECVSVGKRSGRHSKGQASINDLLLVAALAGKRVIRLKGGDPGIFGRAGEEMDHLAAHGITVRICPGITAAAAAAASAGVSLTRRGAAQSLTLLTAHARAGARLDIDWARLAHPATTIAIYMGKAAARMVSAELIAAGLPGATPAIVVENASLPGERIVRTRLDLLEIATAAPLSDGPALLLIGAGCGSGPQFGRLDERIECPQAHRSRADGSI